MLCQLYRSRLYIIRFSVYYLHMRKSDVVEHFGTLTKIAEVLDIGLSSVSEWDEIIPQGRAYQIQVITAGMLKVNQRDYEKK